MPDILHLTSLPLLIALITGQKDDELDHRTVPFAFYSVGLKNNLDKDVALILRTMGGGPQNRTKAGGIFPPFAGDRRR